MKAPASSFRFRLASYLTYRTLVHDVSQPVTSIHALSRALGRETPADDSRRARIDSLMAESERLLSLLEAFQRSRHRDRG